jgi:hypothetical protein
MMLKRLNKCFLFSRHFSLKINGIERLLLFHSHREKGSFYLLNTFEQVCNFLLASSVFKPSFPVSSIPIDIAKFLHRYFSSVQDVFVKSNSITEQQVPQRKKEAEKKDFSSFSITRIIHDNLLETPSVFL